MIQPFEANSAVQMTSMSMTSYSSLLACRFATSWASWSLAASGSRSGVTFCVGYSLFHRAITLVSQPESSRPMANVMGPMPFVEGADPAGEAAPDVHAAVPAVRRRPAAMATIRGIARRIRVTIHQRPTHLVDACYARVLCICQPGYVTSRVCFPAPGDEPPQRGPYIVV